MRKMGFLIFFLRSVLPTKRPFKREWRENTHGISGADPNFPEEPQGQKQVDLLFGNFSLIPTGSRPLLLFGLMHETASRMRVIGW